MAFMSGIFFGFSTARSPICAETLIFMKIASKFTRLFY